MRELNRNKYLFAALITIGIFMLGFLLGLVVDGKRVSYVESMSRKQNLDFSSLQLQYAFIDQMAQEKNCNAVQKTFEQNINNLESTRIRLESFDRNSQINKEEFDTLKNEYLLAQIRYWMLAERTRNLCGSDIVTVLYFFSDEQACPDCDKQGFILTYLKKKFKDRLLIFSFDSNFETEPMIPLLKSTYGVNQYPTVVIDGKVYEGFMDKDGLLRSICKNYQENISDCVGYE